MLANSLLKGKTTIYSKTFGEDIINLGSVTFRMQSNFQYSLVKVTSQYVGRPDLVSEMAYNDDQYGDLICKINGISNPLELNEGMILVIPSSSSLEGFMVEDAYDDVISSDSSNQGNSSPKAKAHNAKRSANESIIGDTRFKIDTTNRIIIY